MTRNPFQKFPTYTQKFQTHHHYPVCFTTDLFAGDNQTIRQTLTQMGHDHPTRCAVFIDSGVVARNRTLIKQITRYFQKEHPFFDLCHPPFVLSGGESVKNNRRLLDEILSITHTHHLTPDGLVFLVGGGAFLDAAGSALAQCRGGIRAANIPTSTLSQCAAGIGTLRFMNACGIKNFSAIAAPPYAVFIDFSLLKTLPFEHHLSGMAEAFKMALATDAEFFSVLVKKARKIHQNDPATVEKVVYKTALLHLEKIQASSDPFSESTTGPSGLGCRVAHWLETRSGDKLTHGHALSVGVALNACYAHCTESLAEEEFSRFIHAMLTCGLPVWNRFLETRTEIGELELKNELIQYQENPLSNHPLMVPEGIGALKPVPRIDFDVLEKSVVMLRQLARKAPSEERRLFIVKPGKRAENNERRREMR
ncbi:hypothetical protein [Desulfoluna sp.]|uniref:3-dehydroquinate synthase family protein n=1 Tax=Desulfoluna sp. TaxID=2045199 RepID=UPI002621F73D|nr:hypothetical protein [Desulfoluna sp.]